MTNDTPGSHAQFTIDSNNTHATFQIWNSNPGFKKIYQLFFRQETYQILRAGRFQNKNVKSQIDGATRSTFYIYCCSEYDLTNFSNFQINKFTPTNFVRMRWPQPGAAKKCDGWKNRNWRFIIFKSIIILRTFRN